MRQLPFTIVLLLCVAVLWTGCDNRPSPPDLPATLPAPAKPHWKIVSISRRTDQVADSKPLDLIVAVEGPSGFSRVSLVTTRAVTGSPPASYLNDVLFPVGEQARLTASLHTVERHARIEVVNQGEESNAIVPIQNLGDVPWVIETSIIAEPAQLIAEGSEAPLGRWICRHGADSWTLTLRVLFSREPVGPRLKPEGKPPR